VLKNIRSHDGKEEKSGPKKDWNSKNRTTLGDSEVCELNIYSSEGGNNAELLGGIGLLKWVCHQGFPEGKEKVPWAYSMAGIPQSPFTRMYGE